MSGMLLPIFGRASWGASVPSNINIIQVPSRVETEEQMREAIEILSRNWRILQTRLNAQDEALIANIAHRLTSPDGSVWEITVDNSGTLITTKIS